VQLNAEVDQDGKSAGRSEAASIMIIFIAYIIIRELSFWDANLDKNIRI